MLIEDFISRWQISGGNESANFQTFAAELCEIIGVDRPKPAQSDGQTNDYRFERPITETHTGRRHHRRIDLYRQGCFVMEAKQGAGPKAEAEQLSLLTEDEAPRIQSGHGRRGTRAFEDTMLRARNQADGYARAVAKEDGWPPFIMVVDVGHSIEVYADFSRQGQGYAQFPDGNRYRITMEDLRDKKVRARLQAIWQDPMSLDPSRTAAKVTREIAGHLAELGKSFEGQGHDGESVARFLMRCLFTMFAEDVELLPKNSFRDKLRELRGKPDQAQYVLQSLWETMNTGGNSPVLMAKLLRFNGGLFKDATALPLSELQLGLLIEAAEADWQQVEPAIFGTLLERALTAKNRHKLGAHYTPRAYVERLVMPTIIEPLRADWRSVQAAVDLLRSQDKDKEALQQVRDFHRKLCEIRVLDPACGSGNFLYVALELMKRLEGEVTALMEELGERQSALGLEGHTVDPHQFLGIELNPWAANVAELVLWIGYLQWHFRTHGQAAPSEPILRDFKNIENRDAVLTWTARTERMNDEGNSATRWDGVTTIRHPATGEEVPDPTARIKVWDYTNPRPAEWPKADFIVGNPPFIGKLKIREDLGDGYVEALRRAYSNVPDSADFVMYWWYCAGLRLQNSKGPGDLRRFGFITTRAAKQTFNSRVMQAFVVDPGKPLSIIFAVADHPWIDTVLTAKVRISMTVIVKGHREGYLHSIEKEDKSASPSDGYEVQTTALRGTIRPNLRLGADILSAKSLQANENMCSMGFATGARGFFLSNREATQVPAEESIFLRKILSAHEIAKIRKNRFIIDAWDFESEGELRKRAPWIYQKLRDQVYPLRAENNDPKLRKEWWRFRRSNRDYRNLKRGLSRFIVAPETSKYRIFTFEDDRTDVEHGAYGIGTSDAEILAVLSGTFHDYWSLAQGGDLGATPRYNKSRCFDPFPFPDFTPAQRTTLRALGEELDAHRKDRQKAHPKLTLTQMYNTLEKLRAGEALEGKDKQVYDDGLIGLLRDIHDRIDASVAEAYGWPANLPEDEILFRLVALNHERAEEEARGNVRWLRPEFQNPDGRAAQAKIGKLEIATGANIAKTVWPKTLPEQITAVREALETLGEADAEAIARTFRRGRAGSVMPLLETLAGLGMAECTDGRHYSL